MLSHYSENDKNLCGLLESVSFTEKETIRGLRYDERVMRYPVHFPAPGDGYGFLHETAGISYHGMTFAAWYNCPVNELAIRPC